MALMSTAQGHCERADALAAAGKWGEASLACVLAAEAYYDARKALQQDDIAASALDMICEDLQARSRYYQGRSRAPVVSQGRIDVSVAKLARKPEQDGKEAVSQFAIAASAAGAAARDLVASTMGDIPSLRKALLEEAMPPPPALNAAREAISASSSLSSDAATARLLDVVQRLAQENAELERERASVSTIREQSQALNRRLQAMHALWLAKIDALMKAADVLKVKVATSAAESARDRHQESSAGRASMPLFEPPSPVHSLGHRNDRLHTAMLDKLRAEVCAVHEAAAAAKSVPPPPAPPPVDLTQALRASLALQSAEIERLKSVIADQQAALHRLSEQQQHVQSSAPARYSSPGGGVISQGGDWIPVLPPSLVPPSPKVPSGVISSGGEPVADAYPPRRASLPVVRSKLSNPVISSNTTGWR